LILLVAVTESIAGFLIVKVQKRTQELESHQKSLVLAEEKFRSLVSAHLHDNLQARLVSIGIQLNQISSSVNSEGAQQIRSVIDEIENIRAQDVREFGRGITPNFQVDGLEVSLERLFSQYKDVISCELHNLADFEPGDQNSHNYLLGVYRVVEQSLLNSLVHGRATKFDVYTNSSSSEVKLKITNNGDSYKAHSATQGHGFAVIDAWMTKFDGSWEISNHEEKVVTEFRWKI
jgi:signal transduction histidine kinase